MIEHCLGSILRRIISAVPNATLVITRRLGESDVPTMGNCSLCDREFDVTDAIFDGTDRRKKLNDLFDLHLKEKHPEERSRSLTHW